MEGWPGMICQRPSRIKSVSKREGSHWDISHAHLGMSGPKQGEEGVCIGGQHGAGNHGTFRMKQLPSHVVGLD